MNLIRFFLPLVWGVSGLNAATVAPEALGNLLNQRVTLRMEVLGTGLSSGMTHFELYSKERWDEPGTVFVRIPEDWKTKWERFGFGDPEEWAAQRTVEVSGVPELLDFEDSAGKPLVCITLEKMEDLRVLPAAFVQKEFLGFHLRVDRAEMLRSPREVRELTRLIETQLKQIRGLVTEEIFRKFQEIPITIRRSPHRAAAAYHWTTDIPREVDNPEWRGVMIRNWYEYVETTGTDQPLALLHEFAHAYHQHVLGGEDHDGIRAAYDHAMEKGLYEKVARLNSEPQQAYATTDDREYFCELTEAWFGANDFFPFNAEELSRHDPMGAELMKTIWGPPHPPLKR